MTDKLLCLLLLLPIGLFARENTCSPRKKRKNLLFGDAAISQ